ncbi:hypothetical protein EST38_g9633 [Candolleomyces aberdarensis]|uniref:Uncharacterized protein n=1 Tax=Candolleomyces aberdarensis TaxID=2316362 RepID=A0A4Q2DCQ6_9AGAR|nr:hypothetical protein EST38_g9633 [Candolleomyces aberdarensis]
MSLAPAKKEISVSPSNNAVVDPVDKNLQAADVERKLKFYGVIQAFHKGRLPSNAQIQETLTYVIDHSPVDVSKLSPEGKKLVQDVRGIIDTARLMVQDKNADELFQNFVWHTRSVDTDSLKDAAASELSEGTVNKEKVKEDGNQAVRHLRTLLTLILTNSEVRKLLSDFALIGRDLISIGASKTSTLLAPHPDKLAEVDRPAPHDQWVTEGGRVVGTNETPVLQLKGKAPAVGEGEQGVGTQAAEIKMHPKHDTQPTLHTEGGTHVPLGTAAQDARSKYHGVTQLGGGLVREAVQEDPRVAAEHGKQELGAQTGRDEGEVRERAEDLRQRGEEEKEDAKKKGFREKVRQVKDNIKDGWTERVPEEHRNKLNENVDGTKKFFSEEYFPEERRDQFIFRLKKVIIECQKHSDYQESMRWLLDFFDEYVEHSKTTGTSVKGAVDRSSGPENHKLNLALAELRTLLERFANNASLSLIIDPINVLIDDGRRDPELREWFSKLNTYIRRVLLEPGYILEPACDSEGRRLVREDGKRFYGTGRGEEPQGKYKGHFDNFWDGARRWGGAVGEDPLNKRFGDDWARLTKDLLFDSDGHLKFKPDLWNDIRRVIAPQLIQQVGYIPIPRIEYTDDSFDLVVENLILQGRNLLPNIVEIEAKNWVKFSPYDSIKDDSHHKVSFTLSQIQADMRDVAFYYRKKQGIPRIKDSGLADVLLGGSGLTVHVTLVSSPSSDKSSVFRVHDVNVKIDTLKFSIRDSKHDLLYKTLKPLATGLVKKQIVKAINEAVRTGLEYVDGQLVGVRDRVEAARKEGKEDGKSRTAVLQEMFTRAKSPELATNASISSTGSITKGDSQFKVVTDKRNSLLADVGNPAGWVNRADGKKGEADRGQDWKSEAFSIVSSPTPTTTRN